MDNKKFFEKCLGVKISDHTWARDKALMKKLNLSVTKTDIQVYASVRLLAKKFGLPIEFTITYFFSQAPNVSVSGVNLYYKILSLLDKTPHRCTLRRWFPGGYQLERIYKPIEVSEVLLHAFIYKLRSSKKLCS